MGGSADRRRGILLAGVTSIAILLGLAVRPVAGPAPLPGASPPPASVPQQVAVGRSVASGLDVYRGLGSWVDVYDSPAWDDPEGTALRMASLGVRTLYLQASNYKRHRAFVFKERVERFIEAAHDHGMAVVAWYLPGFDALRRDLRRAVAAVGLVTPRGDRFDSFALDIESPLVEPPSLRTARLLELSERIRAAVGADYPLGAIIPSPRGMRANPEYWPGFPYRELDRLYDVFVPMTYFTWRTSGLDGARRYTSRVIGIVRAETGDPSVPIHVIGGIAEEATTREARGFVRAIREHGVIGASWYTFPGTTEGQWSELARIPGEEGLSPGGRRDGPGSPGPHRGGGGRGAAEEA